MPETTEIHVVIDRLVVDADAPTNGERLAGALQRELTRLLVEQPPAATGRAVPTLCLPDIAPAAGPDALGRELARALARGLGGAP